MGEEVLVMAVVRGSADDRLREAASREGVVERYWEKVSTSVEPNACWIWTGAVSGHGHGRFWVRDGHVVIAHRLAWALAHPDDDMPEVVEHDCDNPTCQNPAHLVASTNAANRANWAARRTTPGNAARDQRGARGRAVDVRDAALRGASVDDAMQAGLGPLDLDQGVLF